MSCQVFLRDDLMKVSTFHRMLLQCSCNLNCKNVLLCSSTFLDFQIHSWPSRLETGVQSLQWKCLIFYLVEAKSLNRLSLRVASWAICTLCLLRKLISWYHSSALHFSKWHNHQFFSNLSGHVRIQLLEFCLTSWLQFLSWVWMGQCTLCNLCQAGDQGRPHFDVS